MALMPMILRMDGMNNRLLSARLAGVKPKRPEARGNSREEAGALPAQERWPAKGGKGSMISSCSRCLPTASEGRKDGAARPTARGTAWR